MGFGDWLGDAAGGIAQGATQGFSLGVGLRDRQRRHSLEDADRKTAAEVRRQAAEAAERDYQEGIRRFDAELALRGEIQRGNLEVARGTLQDRRARTLAEFGIGGDDLFAGAGGFGMAADPSANFTEPAGPPMPEPDAGDEAREILAGLEQRDPGAARFLEGLSPADSAAFALGYDEFSNSGAVRRHDTASMFPFAGRSVPEAGSRRLPQLIPQFRAEMQGGTQSTEAPYFFRPEPVADRNRPVSDVERPRLLPPEGMDVAGDEMALNVASGGEAPPVRSAPAFRVPGMEARGIPRSTVPLPEFSADPEISSPYFFRHPSSPAAAAPETASRLEAPVPAPAPRRDTEGDYFFERAAPESAAPAPSPLPGANNRFRKALEHIIGLEGGAVETNHPADPGGRTFAGVSERSHPDWPGWESVGEGDRIGALRQASTLYRDAYWDEVAGDEIGNQDVANAIMSAAVHMGPQRAVRLAQQALGVTPDGKMGPETLQILNRVPPNAFVDQFLSLARDETSGIVDANPSLEVFRRGWENRYRQPRR